MFELKVGLHFVSERYNFKPKYCGKFHCAVIISSQNHFPKISLDAKAKYIERMQLKKLAIFNCVCLENYHKMSTF